MRLRFYSGLLVGWFGPVWAEPLSVLALSSSVRWPKPFATCRDLHLRILHLDIYSSRCPHGWPFLIFQVFTQMPPPREAFPAPSQSSHFDIHPNSHSLFHHSTGSSQTYLTCPRLAFARLLSLCSANSLRQRICLLCSLLCPLLETAPSVWHQANASLILLEFVKCSLVWQEPKNIQSFATWPGPMCNRVYDYHHYRHYYYINL